MNYVQRKQALDTLEKADPRRLLAHWPDGRVKLFVIRAILRYRQEHADLFGQGTYRPLKVSGQYADRAVAFAREHEDQTLVVIVPRVTARMGEGFPVGDAWGNTGIALVSEALTPWRELLTGRTVQPDERGVVTLAETLADFPVAVLVR